MALSRERRRKRQTPRTDEELEEDQEPLPVSKKTCNDVTSTDILDETSYYYRDGFRCVYPYYFTFTTHAKGRWVGMTVYDMFSREFQSETPEYYEKAIKSGRVTINGQAVQLSTVINHNDLICHRVHRHEPPVTSLPIQLIHEDSRVVVVNKPSSIPVHPCGRYRHNSVVFILKKEHNWNNLHTIHRLDRLTSGLLMFAKSLETAQQLEHQIRERLVNKKYLCRVFGEFPDTPMECSQPIAVVSHKLGVCRVDKSGKPSSTSFKRLSYNGSSSLLQCEPRTGRMHQIRVHLQWLGFPIIGDPIYNHPAWGPQRGRAGEGTDDIDQVVSAIVHTNYTIPDSSSSTVQLLPEQYTGEGESDRGCDMQDQVEGGESVEDTVSGNRNHNSGLAIACENQEHKRDPLTAQDRNADSTEYSTAKDRNPNQDHLIQQSCSYSVDETVREHPDHAQGRNPNQDHADQQDCASNIDRSISECLDYAKDRNPDHDYSRGRDQQDCTKNKDQLIGDDSDHTQYRNPNQDATEVQECARDKSSIQTTIVDQVINQGEDRCSDHAEARDPDCTECFLYRADPTPQQLMMCLHAASYSGPGWEYVAPTPSWASDEWVPP